MSRSQIIGGLRMSKLNSIWCTLHPWSISRHGFSSLTYIECECEHDEDEEHLQDVPHLFPPLCILTSSSAPFPTWIQTQSVASRLRQCLSLSPVSSFARSAVLHSTERTNYRKSLKDARSRYPPMLESSVDPYLSLANQFSPTLSPFDSAAQTNRNLFQLFLSDFNVLSGGRVQFWLDKTIE